MLILGPHIMISYEPGIRIEVFQLKERLAKEGFRVWIGDEQKHKSKNSMTKIAVVESENFLAVFYVTLSFAKHQRQRLCNKQMTAFLCLLQAHQHLKPLQTLLREQ